MMMVVMTVMPVTTFFMLMSVFMIVLMMMLILTTMCISRGMLIAHHGVLSAQRKQDRHKRSCHFTSRRNKSRYGRTRNFRMTRYGQMKAILTHIITGEG
jgi:hypothetical protein